MFFRLMRDWRGYRAGKIFEPQPGVAEILLRRKIAEPVDAPEIRGQGDKETRRRKR